MLVSCLRVNQLHIPSEIKTVDFSMMNILFKFSFKVLFFFERNVLIEYSVGRLVGRIYIFTFISA